MPRRVSSANALKGRNPIPQSKTLGSLANTGLGAEGAEHVDLPEGWGRVPFLDAIRKNKGRVAKIRQSDYRKTGQYPVIDQGQQQIAGYWDNEADVYRGELPVIIFGDHTRAFKFVDFPFVIGADGTHVLAPNKKCLDAFFLYLALSSLNIPSRGYNRHFGLLKDRFIVAPPLPEQRAISEVLRTVQRGRGATEKVIAATRQLKVSLMKHLFTYGPVPLDLADRVSMFESDLTPWPDHWPEKRLGDCVSLITKGTSPNWQGYEYAEGGVVFVRSQNVGWGNLELSGLAYLPEAFNATHRSSIIREHDVLVNLVGASIGRVAVASKAIAGGNLNQAVGIVRMKPILLPEFVASFLLGEAGQIQFRRQRKEIARANISLQDLRNFTVPIPPIAEQREIVAQLTAVDARLEAEEKRRAALDALFKSLLHHLMTGKLRLPEFRGKAA
jgi:type I restriction enzyme S subunit